MTIYAVWARPKLTGRWIDSLWVRKEAAHARVMQLRAMWEQSGFTIAEDGWWTWLSEMTLEDGCLATSGNDRTAPETQTDSGVADQSVQTWRGK